MRLRADRRRDQRQRAAARAVQRRVAERLVDPAERLEVVRAVEDLHRAAADDAREAAIVGGRDGERVHAVADARRIDVGDVPAEQRTRKVGIRRADVGPRIAVHRRLHVRVVDLHLDAVDAVRVRRPADDRVRARDVRRAAEVRLIDEAERRLILRVVDVDRAPAERGDGAVARRHADFHRVRTVRETGRRKPRHEARRLRVQRGVIRIHLFRIDARIVPRRLMLELIVDVQLDFRDRQSGMEDPASNENHAGLRDRRIRIVERSDDVRLRVERRRQQRCEQSENQAAGNPSPHNPNLQPE